MSCYTYTKAQLEQIVFTQLENLDVMNDLLRITKLQNELLEKVSMKLKDEISEFKQTFDKYPTSLGKKRE